MILLWFWATDLEIPLLEFCIIEHVHKSMWLRIFSVRYILSIDEQHNESLWQRGFVMKASFGRFRLRRVLNEAIQLLWSTRKNELIRYIYTLWKYSQSTYSHFTVQPTSVLTKASVWYEIRVLWAKINHVKSFTMILALTLQADMNQIFQIRYCTSF